LNFLGIREKGVYGNRDYSVLLALIEKKAEELNIEVETFQSNGEGEIIDRLQRAYYDKVDGIIINPAAYTHYSYAIRDALASLAMPKIEVHISNIHEREEFRKISVTAPVCDMQIMGHGLEGYLMAMETIVEQKGMS
jgi:3-dehydroquinate dehydratase-2